MKLYVSISHPTHIENLRFTSPQEAREYAEIARLSAGGTVALRTRPMLQRSTRKQLA